MRTIPEVIHMTSRQKPLSLQGLRSRLDLRGAVLILVAPARMTDTPKTRQTRLPSTETRLSQGPAGASRSQGGRKKAPWAQRFASPPTLV